IIEPSPEGRISAETAFPKIIIKRFHVGWMNRHRSVRRHRRAVDEQFPRVAGDSYRQVRPHTQRQRRGIELLLARAVVDGKAQAAPGRLWREKKISTGVVTE